MRQNHFLSLLLVGLLAVLTAGAQDVSQIQFCDKKYEYSQGKDSITLFLKVLDGQGNRVKDLSVSTLDKYLVIYEDGTMIPNDRRTLSAVSSGQRIPGDFTFSVLVDLSIPQEGKQQICSAVGKLVEAAPDSCVYLSFFGHEVSPSVMVTKANYDGLKEQFQRTADGKCFYSALYAKLTEFSGAAAHYDGDVKTTADYAKNRAIGSRFRQAKDRSVLIVFTDGNRRADDETIGFVEVTDYQSAADHEVPRVFALYYTGAGIDENVKLTLEGVSVPRDANGNVMKERQGGYKPSDNFGTVLSHFEQVVNDAMYDYAFAYKATNGRSYTGKVNYMAEWKGIEAGEGNYSIGTAETPWPLKAETAAGALMKLLVALLVALLTYVFFFFVMKVLIPAVKSKRFAMKYYKSYVPEANVQRRICHYCKQDIEPGQKVVTRCKHIIHVACWQQNGYKCVEYGQNCKDGIQDHVDWSDMLSKASLRDSYQALSGIVAGLVSWMIFELTGRGLFHSLGATISRVFFTNEAQRDNLLGDCTGKLSAFLTVGLLLGFFLSLVFRYNDEYRKKDAKVYLKIVGLSLLSALIGMAAFAVGGIIFCLLLSAVGTTYIPWYCSLPAYLLFSVCTALGLTIKSSIPLKSALIGGLCSAVIGFVVLYFSGTVGSGYGWMNMLLDFIIYGGGLGASLVTVRMLAEKYFLVIKNGVKAGQRIPIHKWMSATGGGNKVTIGMTGECEIQMNWEKSNKVAKQHVQLFIDHARQLPMLKPLASGVIYNIRTELPVNRPSVLSNGDTFKVGDTTFEYVEN